MTFSSQESAKRAEEEGSFAHSEAHLETDKALPPSRM